MTATGASNGRDISKAGQRCFTGPGRKDMYIIE